MFILYTQMKLWYCLNRSSDLTPLFRRLGLTNYESRLWQALLEKGEADAQELIRATGVPFGRIYDVLNSLVKKGIIEVQDTRPKRFRPRRIRGVVDRLLNTKKTELDEEYRGLEEAVEAFKRRFERLDKAVSRDEVFVTVALGEQDTASLVKEQVESAESEILIAVGQVESPSRFSNMADEAFRQLIETVARGVSVRVILSAPLTPILKTFDSIMQKAWRQLQIRVYRGSLTHFKVIDRRYVVLEIIDPLEPEHRIATVQLLSKKLAEHMTRVFEQCWEDSQVQVVDSRRR